MEAEAGDECQGVRRFNPFRSVRRGLKAACRWTIRLGRGRPAAAPGCRAGRRSGRGRRGAPPLASLAAAMLEPDEILDLGNEACVPSTSGHQHLQPPRVSSGVQLIATVDAVSGGNSFPLVLRRPNWADASAFPDLHNQQRRALRYHAHADDSSLYDGHHHHHNHQHALAQHDDAPWMHHHHHRTDFDQSNRACSCDGASAGMGCGAGCPAAAGQHLHIHSSSGSGSRTPGNQQGQVHPAQGHSGHSLQHLLAVGSRQWGSGGWWDGRGLLRVKIYDFAIYADPVKAAQALRSAAASSEGRFRRQLGNSGGGGEVGGARTYARGAGGGGGGPAELLVSPCSRVDMSLTIRACRNLPLHMLSQEFERVLQRRHQKAGGQPDDPALRELLSYFSRERLPEHVVVSTSSPLSSSAGDATSPSSSSGEGDAVRKGASITFSRSPCGSLVTEAGGRVLGRVHSPALAEALFDLYLGDQPVSKRAKAAAGAALLDLAGGWGRAPEAQYRYRYRPQAGERLVCAPGARNPGDVDACVVQVP